MAETGTQTPTQNPLQYVTDQLSELRAKGVPLKATEQQIDTSTAGGKAFLDMLGVFAEFETNLRKERQLEGIAKAKAAGHTAQLTGAHEAPRLLGMGRGQDHNGVPSSRNSLPRSGRFDSALGEA